MSERNGDALSATRSKSETRRERTLATRRRMVGAAYRLFCEKGYVATTMEAIAREADVAVPTLYFTFRTKGAILGEALGAAVMGFDEPVGPEDSSWYGEFQAEPDARRALRILVENSTPILRRVGPLMAATYPPRVILRWRRSMKSARREETRAIGPSSRCWSAREA